MNVKFNFWIGILIIWLSHLMMDFSLGVWTVYKTFITLDLRIAGLIASVAMLIGEGLQLYFGILSDRGFHRRLIALGVGLTLTIPFLAYTQNEWLLFLLVLSSFIGSGAFHPAASSLLASFSSKHKSFFLALFICGGTIGAASSQYMFIKLYSVLDKQTWVLSIPIILLMIGCLGCKFPKFSQTPSSQGHKSTKKIGEMLRPRRAEILTLYFIAVCLQMVGLSFSFLLPDILRVKGYEEWFCLGGGCFYFMIGSALMSMPIGYCIDRIGYKSILGTIIVSSIVLLHLFLTVESLSLVPISLLLMLMGGTMGVVVPTVLAGGNSLVPFQASGFISALYMGGVSGIAGMGPLLSGLLASYFSDDAPVRALQVLSGLLMIALVLLYFLPRSSAVSELEPRKITISSN